MSIKRLVELTTLIGTRMTPLVDFVLATNTIDKTLLKKKTWRILTAIELNDKVGLRTARNPIDTWAKENEGWRSHEGNNSRDQTFSGELAVGEASVNV